MKPRRRRGPPPDELVSGPSIGMLALELTSALCELHARGKLTGVALAYGLRLIVRRGRDGQFFEAVETSARVLGVSRKSAQRARERMVSLGLLHEVGGKHAPGRARRFVVRIPADLIASYQARLADEPSETGDKVLSPVEQAEDGAYRGQVETEQGTSEAATGDKSGPNRGQSFVPETSEPMNLKEPGSGARPIGSAVAAADAPLRMGAPRGGGMTDAAIGERKRVLREQALALTAQGQAERLGRDR